MWWKEKKGQEATVALAAGLADAAGGGAALATNIIAGAAMVESARALAEPELAGTWLPSVTGIAHSLAIDGCPGDGGVVVASGYLVVVSTLLASRAPPCAIMYDEKLRRLICETEDMAVEDVRCLFHEKNPSVVSEVVADLEPSKSQRATQPQQQQRHQRQPWNQRPRQQPPAAGRSANRRQAASRCFVCPLDASSPPWWGP